MNPPDIAHDLHVLAQSAHENHDRHDGWCFGLPPGIAPEDWPLDPENGYPMMHGFTLKLPPEYRCHGPDIVAFSFFGTAGDHNDGGPATNRAIAEAMAATEAPADPALRPFWQAMQCRHPRLHRMEDILGCQYAVILLTQAEFDGPFCRPPALIDSPLLAGVAPPHWLEKGSAAATGHMNFAPASPEADSSPFARQNFTETRPFFNRGLKLMPRRQDPNAGKIPVEAWDDEPTESGYQRHYYWQDGVIEAENHRVHDWAKGHATNHLGGTMRPCQAIPQGFGPFYVEFEEYLGGFNFGGGNAQLDFQNMRFDWACG